MKRMLVALLLIVLLMAVLAVPAMAAKGGMPAAHGLDGHEFGEAVSALAKDHPGAVAHHIHMMRED